METDDIVWPWDATGMSMVARNKISLRVFISLSWNVRWSFLHIDLWLRSRLRLASAWQAGRNDPAGRCPVRIRRGRGRWPGRWREIPGRRRFGWSKCVRRHRRHRWLSRRSPSWRRSGRIGEAALKIKLRMEAGLFGVKKFSGQGALRLRDGFR